MLLPRDHEAGHVLKRQQPEPTNNGSGGGSTVIVAVRRWQYHRLQD